ncbi:MAG: polysaccharide ABC transporter ATP-binding protein [Clostridia bacterium]|nr:polysaccharide ABC transporter ATP-binding protein [Clostridia bacterium]
MDTVIKVKNIGKSYIIKHKQQERYTALRDVISNKIRTFGKKPEFSSNEEFWALKDLSFEINQGDRVGIIGRNGAGKSTLLKILSRITEPTVGRVGIKGRVASLLEVGTGFHPELTGRENIYLNGAVLGMKKAEIKRKFDEIIDFAEVEKFLDTPVKRYSSGMYVRLAFAVAAHLEPEILVVDEVLAVGDAQFQKKCLGKMEQVGKNGRTVLFVSHNMGAIEQLCKTAILLEKGRLKDYSNNVRGLIKEYVFGKDVNGDSFEWINHDGNEYKNDWFTPKKFCITNESGNKLGMPASNDRDIYIQIEADINKLDPALNFGYAIYNEEGILLYWTVSTDGPECSWPKIKKGHNILRNRIPMRLLNEGIYKISLIGSLHFRQWLCNPEMNSPSIYLNIQGGLSDSPYWNIKRPGVIAPVLDWKVFNN